MTGSSTLNALHQSLVGFALNYPIYLVSLLQSHDSDRHIPH